jgi:hypothetical protein
VEGTCATLSLFSNAVFASDFGPMVAHALALLAVFLGGALLLGTATAGVVYRIYGRKRVWFFSQLFAILWFLVILGIHELWLQFGRPAAREAPPRPAPNYTTPVPEPEHD